MATRHHHTANGGISNRRAARNAAFQDKIRQMRLPLAPLVQMSTGAVHPAFPATLLNFWLLTEDQLDDLARFYHQRSPSPWSGQYPCPITWQSGLSLGEKRRKIGKFIGLRLRYSNPDTHQDRGADHGGGAAGEASGGRSGPAEEDALVLISVES
ncbi:hypothetical protein CSUB01_06884 [Colletotrichum sublineola]|uniref:Beta-xylosidase n=1 Tax=Colletotrichum sublineola TaxID=1173701 RepID=A0A066XDF1_COLSU|nr:hypothetical protein CSUB01_06884 [Colletotrichum sublineola]